MNDSVLHESVLVVLCTCPDDREAERLARGLVENCLAACVNILPGVRSMYRWQGEIQSSAEVLLLIKTTQAGFAAVRDWLAAEHSYDTPEIVAIAADEVLDRYAHWIYECVRTDVSRS